MLIGVTLMCTIEIEEEKNMKIAIIGAGSLGCALAGLFSQGGADVTVYDRNETVLDTIRRQGVTIKMKERTIQSSRIAAESLPGDLRSYDLVCVAVKSTQTEYLMGELMGSAGQDTVFFTMQSGLDNTDLLAAYVPRNHILCGMGFWTMEQKADGEVKLCTLPGHPVELAMLEAGRDAKGLLKDVRKLFEKAGVNAEIKKEPQPVLWKNAIFQSGLQPVVTALRMKIGTIAADENGQWLIQHIWKEGCNISRAEGVEDLWPVFQKLLPELEEHMGECSCAMAEDLLIHHRHTEIAGLNEVIISRGKKLGVPTPVNQSILHVILAMQSNQKAV